MTNEELIAKIKAEIERLKGIGGIVPLDNREQKTGYESALIDVETFIDSLESEKPMNPVCESKFKVGDVIQFKDGTNQYKICGVFSDHYTNSIGNRMDMSYTDANFELVEYPVCEGLEEEIERCVIEPYYDLDGVAVKGATVYITVNDVADLARHFAEWGYLRAAEKYNEVEYNRQRAEESVPNDLEEAAKEYAKTSFTRPYSDNPDEYADNPRH